MQAKAIVFQAPQQLLVNALAAQWQRDDLLTVTSLAHSGHLSLSELITHAELPGKAEAAYQTAFGDADCLKMILDWTHSA